MHEWSLWIGEGIAYHFFHYDATRFFGFRSIWLIRLEKAMVTDLERTTLRMIKELEPGVSLVDPAAKEQRDLYQIILKYD